MFSKNEIRKFFILWSLLFDIWLKFFFILFSSEHFFLSCILPFLVNFWRYLNLHMVQNFFLRSECNICALKKNRIVSSTLKLNFSRCKREGHSRIYLTKLVCCLISLQNCYNKKGQMHEIFMEWENEEAVRSKNSQSLREGIKRKKKYRTTGKFLKS